MLALSYAMHWKYQPPVLSMLQIHTTLPSPRSGRGYKSSSDNTAAPHFPTAPIPPCVTWRKGTALHCGIGMAACGCRTAWGPRRDFVAPF